MKEANRHFALKLNSKKDSMSATLQLEAEISTLKMDVRDRNVLRFHDELEDIGQNIEAYFVPRNHSQDLFRDLVEVLCLR